MIEIVPPERYGALIARIGVVIIVATVLGPIIGGEISNSTTWRWIFLFKYLSPLHPQPNPSDIHSHPSHSVPIGVIAMALAVFGIPSGFPYHGRPEGDPFHETTAKIAFSRLDLPGFVLLMFATLSFTACFQEADAEFAWDSAYVVALLVGSVVLWVGLLWWERYVTRSAEVREPVLPWRFFVNRGMVGILL